MRERKRQKRGFIYLQVAHGPFGHAEKWLCGWCHACLLLFPKSVTLLTLSTAPSLNASTSGAHYYIRFSTFSMMTTTNGCDRHTRDSRPACLEPLDVRCFFSCFFYNYTNDYLKVYYTSTPNPPRHVQQTTNGRHHRGPQ
jgi:hypothetical protein